MNELVNEELFSKAVFDSQEDILNGRTFVAQFDDALLMLSIEEDTFKVDIVQGGTVKYDGNLLKLEEVEE